MIYDNIVELAKKRNMPLYKIEKEAGLANGVISKWKSNSPQVDNLMAVARVLNVTLNRLVRGYESEIDKREN